MWKQGEDVPSQQRLGALDNLSDADVSILDRGGKLAVLERSAHRLILGRWDLTTEYERLGSPADRRVTGTDEHLPGACVGESGVANPPLSGGLDPELARAVGC